MPAKNEDLHGFVPDASSVVMLIIDVINRFDFPEGQDLLEYARPMTDRIVELKARAREAQVPVIYVNDNFGRWRSDFRKLLAAVLDDTAAGHSVARKLLPESDDYFVLKPKHSAFFSTTLDTLLQYLGAKTLIITGVAGNICVLFTANDAFLRDYNVVVPSDCCASNTREANDHALDLMRTVLHADTSPSHEVDFKRLLCEGDLDAQPQDTEQSSSEAPQSGGSSPPRPQPQLAEMGSSS